MSLHPSEILIVEDDEAIREVLSEAFRLEGFGVTLAENGKEGLSFLSRKNYSLIVLDWLMPVMGGEEFIKLLNTRDDFLDYRSIPIIVLSGDRTKNMDFLDSHKDATIECLDKPIDLDNLLHSVKSLCLH